MYPNNCNPYTNYRVQIPLPEFPYVLIESMERVLEYVDDELVAERIESIFREIQVFQSRTRRLEAGDDISTQWLATLILEAAAIYARAESLFTYARGKSPSINSQPLWDRVFAALCIMNIHNDDVSDLATLRKAKGYSPGEADTKEPW